MLLSIVVPCYNEEKMLKLFYEELRKVVDELESPDGGAVGVEVIFVDDGSTDASLRVIKELGALDNHVHFISLSRNFGKESSLYAGLEAAQGDYVAVMDADLQDPPQLLLEMLKEMSTGEFDCVGTRRVTRKGEPPIRSWFARRFYGLINSISDIQLVDGARDYRLMSRQMVNAVCQLKEVNRFSKGIFAWVGFKTKWLEYENVQRAAGETKWSFWKLFLYSIEGIISFATAPLVLVSAVGIVFFMIAIIMALVYGVKAIVWGDPVAGFPTLICMILLLGGLQLFALGVIGQYLAKTYSEVKRRPIYIVKEKG